MFVIAITEPDSTEVMEPEISPEVIVETASLQFERKQQELRKQSEQIRTKR